MRSMIHCILAALVAGLAAPPVAAQSARQLPTAGTMAGGYSGARASTGVPTDYSLRDPSGNLIVVNGQLQSGSSYQTGAGSVGQSAFAIGNQITVQASGSWNTIIVDAVQTNTGDVTAHAGATSARAGQD